MTQFSASAAWRQSVPSLLTRLAIGMTIVGLGTWATWMGTGDWTLVNFYLRDVTPVLTVAVCLIEAGLCWQVWRSLEEDDAMRTAWLWLFLASVAHLTGRTAQYAQLSDIGRMISGPLQMSLLVAGLANIVRVFWRLRLLRRLTAGDYAMLAMVGAFAFRSGYAIYGHIAEGKPVTFPVAVIWTSDPMLLALLVMAILLHRSASVLGHGMLTNVWRSYVTGILLTAVGSASAWTYDGGVHVWTSLGWYVWFAADCAYALAPALQMAAIQHARNRARVFAAFAENAFWRLP